MYIVTLTVSFLNTEQTVVYSMRICDMWGILLQERVILAGPIFRFHFQLLEHACGGLKYEIQSKAFSETSSENSSTGSGIHMYT